MPPDGPFLIVGVPRSGTTLLRDLLAGSAQIALPPEESQLLPDLFLAEDRFGSGPEFISAAQDLVRSSNFSFLLRRRHDIPTEALVESVKDASDAVDVLRSLVLASQAWSNAAVVWGDKTPNYIHLVERVLSARPDATFIYMVRDPRDVALSMKSAWGRSTVRSALEWASTEALLSGLTDAGLLRSSNLFELQYERLLQEPEDSLKRLSTFLGVEFDPAMLQLRASSEHWGSAAGHAGLKGDNIRKYRDLQPARHTRTVEAVCRTAMSDRGYEPTTDPATHDRPVPRPVTVRIAKTVDAVRVVSRYVKDFGIIDGIRYKMRQGGLRRWKADNGPHTPDGK